MSDIKSYLAHMDMKTGMITIPLPASKQADTEAQKHYKECYSSLPPINAKTVTYSSEDVRVLVTEEQAKANRSVLAIIQPCCGVWYAPEYYSDEWGLSSEWYWEKVSAFRRWRWKRKGWI